jgi:hypothetical protein
MPSRSIRHRIGQKVADAETLRHRANSLRREAAEQLGMVLQTANFISDLERIGDPRHYWLGIDDIEGRLDPLFGHPHRKQAVKTLKKVGSVVQLGELAKAVRRRLDPGDSTANKYPFIGLADIDASGSIDANTSFSEMESQGQLARQGEILFSRLRPNLNKVSIVPAHMSVAACSSEFEVLCAEEVDAYYLMALLRTPLIGYQAVHMTGGSLRPRLDSHDLMESLWVVRLTVDMESEIGDKLRSAEKARYTAKCLIDEAIDQVEDLIQGANQNTNTVRS